MSVYLRGGSDRWVVLQLLSFKRTWAFGSAFAKVHDSHEMQVLYGLNDLISQSLTQRELSFRARDVDAVLASA